MSGTPKPLIVDDLETMVYNLQTIIDWLEQNIDQMTVGDIKRIRVLARAVREGTVTITLLVE